MTTKEEIEALEKKISCHRQSIIMYRAQVEALEHQIDRLNSEQEKELSPLYKKMREIEDKYTNQIIPIKKEVDTVRNEIELHHKAQIEAEDTLTLAQNEDSEYFTEDEFIAYIRKNNLMMKEHDTPNVKAVEKKLKNGVQIVRRWDSWSSEAVDSEFMMYYVIKDKKIVGFMYTYKAQHRGDSATHFAWINETVLERDNMKLITKTGRYGYQRKEVPSFREWKAVMEQTTEFVAVDMTNEKNRKILSGDVWDI